MRLIAAAWGMEPFWFSFTVVDPLGRLPGPPFNPMFLKLEAVPVLSFLALALVLHGPGAVDAKDNLF
jgi:hypothetical protein